MERHGDKLDRMMLEMETEVKDDSKISGQDDTNRNGQGKITFGGKD